MSERELVEAIRKAETTGQWSEALDLIRTGLVEPLTRERDQLRKALRMLVDWAKDPDEIDPGPAFQKARAVLGDTPDE